MDDYAPISLAACWNAGSADLGIDHTPPLGRQLLRGLPFELGSHASACCVLLGGERSPARVDVPIGGTAHSVVFAHRLIDSDVLAGGPVGRIVAEYTLQYADGELLSQPIRERYEIGVPSAGLRDPRGGQMPALAVPDVAHALPPRLVGEFGLAGRRQTGLRLPPPSTYFLWAWRNPRPDVAIERLYLLSRGPRVAIAGITIGHVDEHPLLPGQPASVHIDLLDPTRGGRPFDLAVAVDRGVAGFAYPLSSASDAAHLADPLAGFGEAPNHGSTPAYVRLAATSSARVSVSQAGESLTAVRWHDLQSSGALISDDVRLTLASPDRNWVRTRVLDAATGQPIACRVHFRSPAGVPFQPHGHHAHVNGDLDSWHLDLGGDVRLGQLTYAYIDGSCEGWLPRGEVIVDVARGFEYRPLRTRLTIASGQQELTLRLERIRELNAERWFSGDTHVHFLSTQGAQLEAQGEDLNVVNLLQSQWGELFTNTEDFVGRPVVTSDGRTIVYASQENRQHFLGHLGLLGLTRPVVPWCSDGPMEAELGGTLETSLAHWADACHTQGGTVVLAHLPNPNGEPAALIATGRVDAVEMIEHLPYSHLEYYRYLNAGYRLPLVGGTDRMSNAVPVGLYRTYVRIPPDEAFDYASWCRNLRLGRTFLSGGPLLSLSVEGHDIGDTVVLPASGGVIEVEARAQSIFPMHTLQVVQHGEVVAETNAPDGAFELVVRARLKIERSTWIAARVGGPGYAPSLRHHDVWGRGVFAHTSPIYVACGGEWHLFEPATAEYMLTLIDMSLAHIHATSRAQAGGHVVHHHGEADHAAYLERPFLEAQAAIRSRQAAHP